MNTQNVNGDMLLAEAKEIHEYLRHMTNLTMTWFTFFGTSNVVALGWFAIEADLSKAQHTFAMYIVAAFFIVQSVLGAVSFVYMKKHIVSSIARHQVIIEYLSNPATDSRARSQPPQTPAAYAKLLNALIAAFTSFVVLWLAMVSASPI